MYVIPTHVFEYMSTYPGSTAVYKYIHKYSSTGTTAVDLDLVDLVHVAAVRTQYSCS